MDSPALTSFKAKDSLQGFIANQPPSRPVWWKGTYKRLPRDRQGKKKSVALRL